MTSSRWPSEKINCRRFAIYSSRPANTYVPFFGSVLVLLSSFVRSLRMTRLISAVLLILSVFLQVAGDADCCERILQRLWKWPDNEEATLR